MSDSKELTPWFPANVKPARVGVYIATVARNETYYRYWDGIDWHIGSESASRAHRNKGVPLLRNSQARINWRGLANPQKDPS